MVGVYTLIVDANTNYSIKAPVNKMYKIVAISGTCTVTGNVTARVATRGYKRQQLDNGIIVENSLNNDVIFSQITAFQGENKVIYYPNDGVVTKFISIFSDKGTSTGSVTLEVQYEIVDGSLTNILYETLRAKELM